MRLAYVAAKDRLPSYASQFSRRDFTLPQLFACLVVKEQLKLSYRKAELFLLDCPDWCAQIGLHRVPDHNTLCRAAKLLLSQQKVNHLLDLLAQWAAQAKLLRLSTHPLALDSTTYESHHVSRHYEHRRRQTRDRGQPKGRHRARSSQSARRLPKLALGVASGCHLVLSLWTGTGVGADHPHYRRVVREARERVPDRHFKVVADAGYDSEAAHAWTRGQMKLQSLIPPQLGRPRNDGGPPGGYWRARMKRQLGSSDSRRRSGYTQRWQAETTHSMMKRNLSSSLAGRTAWSRRRDMMLKALVHNLMILRPRGSRQSTHKCFVLGLGGIRATFRHIP